MAVKVADVIESMNPEGFPAMMGKSVNLVKEDGTEKSLQAMFDDKELGGGGDGLPTPEAKDKVLLTKINGDTLKPEWQQVDKGEVGLQLPEFESLEEWDSLPADEKSKYYNTGKGYVVIKEDVKGAKGVIDDTKPTSTVTTLSAKKINDSLVDIESALDHRAYINYGTTESDANNLPDGFVSSNNLKNAPLGGHVFYRTFSYDGNSEYRAQEATTIGNARKFIRYKNGGTWFDWQELATMDKVQKGLAYTVNSFTCPANTQKIVVDDVRTIGVNWTVGWSAFIMNRNGFVNFNLFGDGNTLYLRNNQDTEVTGMIILYFNYI